MVFEMSLEGLCRFVRNHNKGEYISDPEHLSKFFRKYAGIEGTPNLKRTLNLTRALGINIEEVDYLSTAGTNMTAKGVWYVHYSAKDRPATQKFTIYHELFEIIQKSCAERDSSFHPLEEPLLSRAADRFAGAVLLPRQFFLNRIIETGCDLVKLGEALELSQQCLMVAMQQHLDNVPLIGAIYDQQVRDGIRSRQKTNDYSASMVVKTSGIWTLQQACPRQSEPVAGKPPQSGSLICAALHGGFPIFYHSQSQENSAAVLVRPLLSGNGSAYRVILLVLPNAKSSRFFPQVDVIEAVTVDENSPCPSAYKCRSSQYCRWKTTGSYPQLLN